MPSEDASGVQGGKTRASSLPHNRSLRGVFRKVYLIAVWLHNGPNSPCVVVVIYEKDYVYGLPVISRLNIGQLCMVSRVKVIGAIFLRARLDFHVHIRHPRQGSGLTSPKTF